MSQYFELKEKTEHGTERDPVWYVEFDMKNGTPDLSVLRRQALASRMRDPVCGKRNA